jgi:hypothetical protein
MVSCDNYMLDEVENLTSSQLEMCLGDRSLCSFFATSLRSFGSVPSLHGLGRSAPNHALTG